MQSIEIIKNEILFVKKQTDDLIEQIEESKWNTTPEIILTNINWQIGHITIANYLHGIASINSKNREFNERINLKDYIKFYGIKSKPSEFNNEKPSNKEIKEIYEYVFNLIWKEIDNLEEIELKNNIEIPNPDGKTKLEALMMLFKHQSWHNGQIALLKRVLNN